MKPQDLKNEELKDVNGGGLLGNDSNMLKGVLQGSVGISNTDEDGDTESTNVDFGLGSLLDSKND